MKKNRKRSDSKVIKGMFITACAVLFFMGHNNISHAQMTGKISAASARIRQQADMDSVAIGSAAQGTTVTIVNDITDSAGTRWFEVNVDGTSGYIRSDLINVDAGSEVASAETPQAPAASGAESTAETPMDAQYATVKVPNAKVRSTPSTSSGTVDGLPNGTQVIISGQSTGSDSKIWYYVDFTSTSGEGKTGFIRSDLLELGEMVPVEQPQEPQPEEQQPEETPAPEPEHLDYEVVYDANEGVWWLYDYTGEGNGTYQNLEQVIAAAHAQGQIGEEAEKTISKQRIVIIVLIALIIILAVVMTIMIFKLRDAYYEAYEDDDEEEDDEEEEEEEPPVRRRESSGRRREEADRKKEDAPRKREESGRRREEREEPVRRKSTARDEQQPVRKKTASSAKTASARENAYERDASAPAKTAPKRKTKNFMADEDEFEFEFLNMKDKDRDI